MVLKRKKAWVSSVNTIKPAEIVIPSRSLSNTLAGQIAGVIAIQRSGELVMMMQIFGFVAKVRMLVVPVLWYWSMVYLVA